MMVTFDAKRRLTVPSAFAPVSPGDYFDARFDAEEDEIVFAGRQGDCRAPPLEEVDGQLLEIRGDLSGGCPVVFSCPFPMTS